MSFTGSNKVKRNLAFAQIFALTPKCNTIFIAGGSVVDIDKCTDIDIWFGNNNLDLAQKFLDALPYKDIFENVKQYAGNAESLVLGEGYIDGIGKPIQVLVTRHKNARELMEHFDISTHHLAFTSHGTVIADQYFTHHDWPPKIIHKSRHTLARYAKICARYGHPVDPEVLAQWSTSASASSAEIQFNGLTLAMLSATDAHPF